MVQRYQNIRSAAAELVERIKSVSSVHPSRGAGRTGALNL